jgi:cobalt/nickel transport system ATP-binding protein
LQLSLSAEEVKTRIEDGQAMMEIGKFRDRSPHTLSGGEKKKVSIAIVLVNPGVLLLDELTAGLDPRTQLWFIELLQDLRREGKVVITATHDLDVIEKITANSIEIYRSNQFYTALHDESIRLSGEIRVE